MPELSRPEPSRLYRWTVLLFVSLAMGGNYYIYDSINPLERIFIDKLGFSATAFGWLNSAYSVAAVATLLIGGIIIDGGTFPWADHPERFGCLIEPEPAFHGVRYASEFSHAPYITRCRTVGLRNTGATMPPFNAFLLLQGLETLHLRLVRHSENALAVAKFLERHPKVTWTSYPGLESSPQHAKAKKYLPRGAGAILGFGIKGGATAGARFIDSLSLISHVANVGDAKTLAIHPATTTHQQLSPEEQKRTGVTPDYVRLSVGIEHIDDILEDVGQALEKA